MSEVCRVAVERRGDVAVLSTDGYINNQGGEEIAKVSYELLDQGYKVLLLNLAGTKIVNSIGISILIEIIEKSLDSPSIFLTVDLVNQLDHIRVTGSVNDQILWHR